MSTFINPGKIRELAATGDVFYRGAAWVLDQQDAARIDTTDYDSEWTRARANMGPLPEVFADLTIRPAVIPNAADLGSPRIP